MNSTNNPVSAAPITIDFNQTYDPSLLVALARANPHILIFDSGTTYDATLLTSNQKVKIKISHDIFAKKLANGAIEYKIIGDKIAEGRYGDVYDLLGGFILESDNSIIPLINLPAQVVKVQEHSKKYPYESALHEFHVSAKTDHLGIEKPIKINMNGIDFSFTVMNKFKGKNLAYYFETFCTDTSKQSSHHMFKNDFDQALRFALQIAIAIKNQVHDKEILHRDLKPENIIVDEDELNHTWNINIIDFGLSRLKGKKDDKVPGSPGFFAPEVVCNRLSTRKSDIYSFGVLLAMLMGAGHPGNECEAHNDAFIHIWQVQKNGFRTFSNLFSTQNQTPRSNPDDLKIIDDLIKICTSLDKRNRPSMDMIILDLKNLIQQRANIFPNYLNEIDLEHFASKPTR